MAWDVSEAVESSQPCGQEENGEQRTYTVKRMLMKRSQLHPAMYAAAAGGKIIATYENENVEIHFSLHHSASAISRDTYDDEDDV